MITGAETSFPLLDLGLKYVNGSLPIRRSRQTTLVDKSVNADEFIVRRTKDIAVRCFNLSASWSYWSHSVQAKLDRTVRAILAANLWRCETQRTQHTCDCLTWPISRNLDFKQPLTSSANVPVRSRMKERSSGRQMPQKWQWQCNHQTAGPGIVNADWWRIYFHLVTWPDLSGLIQRSWRH